jgi:hypothetical protein
MRRLRLFYRPDCHLCEEMLEQLAPYRQRGLLALELIDIDRSGDALSAYRTRIPVLENLAGECLCEYFLDEDALLSYLEGG